MFAGLLIRALPALLNDHGVDGNLANAFYGFALLVSLIQGRKGLAGQLADFYKFVRISRIVEGAVIWGGISVGLACVAAFTGAAGFAGALFIALIALLFRQAIPGVCWMLLGFFGKRVQDFAEELEAAASLRLARIVEAFGGIADHRILKRTLNVLFIGFFVGWVAWGVFDVDYAIAVSIIWSAIALKFCIELLLYPAILPLRHRLDARFPKPFASYR